MWVCKGWFHAPSNPTPRVFKQVQLKVKCGLPSFDQYPFMQAHQLPKNNKRDQVVFDQISEMTLLYHIRGIYRRFALWSHIAYLVELYFRLLLLPAAQRPPIDLLRPHSLSHSSICIWHCSGPQNAKISLSDSSSSHNLQFEMDTTWQWQVATNWEIIPISKYTWLLRNRLK